jgi:tight adherence protein C
MSLLYVLAVLGGILFTVIVMIVALSIGKILQQTSSTKRMFKFVNDEKKIFGEFASPLDRMAHWFAQTLTPLARYSAPGGAWETSPLHSKLYAAGYRKPSAVLLYFGLKTVLTVVLPSMFLLVSVLFDFIPEPQVAMLFLFIFAVTGYFLPSIGLSYLVSRRRRELFENFPDALDLMRICIQAGLALDVAIARVGEEVGVRSKALADEFHQVVLEQRAGATRHAALKNLALRVNLPDVDSLVSTLVQAERFGTSVAESLAVHSEGLRQSRQLNAEELAAKIPTKILLPVILCIFPVLFIIILGPAISQVKHLMAG